MQDEAKTSSRRTFFKRALAGSVVSGATLSTLGAHMALAHGDRDDDERDHHDRRGARRSDYGDLQPTPDQDGNTILALPKDFRYVTFSKTGDAFDSGLLVPRNHDGMACFEGRGNTVRLIRNHELRNAAGDFTLGVNAPVHLRYDAKGMGGCMTLDFDTKRKRLVRQFVSIGGTFVNCSGGWSRNNSGWITCEETTAGVTGGFEKPHGYNFFVPANADSTVAAVALKAMGRFAHEASVADDRGIVYQTEDSGNNSGLYRFIPNDPRNLLTGGSLQMLAVTGNPTALMFTGQRVGVRLPVHWVPIPVPDPSLEGGGMSCFAQGRAAGGAAFNRLEGIFRAHDGESMYFVSTSGGTAQRGQLWHYIPDREGDRLVLVFESPLGSVLDSPDNLCITPTGGILFCEDDASGDSDTHPLAPGITDVNRLIGLGIAGEPFEFA
ncbi:MAG TPA: alkaline phosphatase PhoX, partial [Burkholderiales bacterium]|nr:alkaline phosphatase PhoX [Burkholderiales bacterium]